MTVIRSARVVMCLAALFAVAACSNNSNRAVTATVGVDTGVALTTAGSVTSVLAGQTLALGATVANASNNAGVTWVLVGAGTLTDVTTTSATYSAPASVTGSTTALVTATSVTNPAQLASVGLIVLGTPEINNETLFPGNVNVPYQASVSAAGGDAPFTWIVLSGALPPGLALSGATGAITNIQGTPTTTGTYTFSLQATDTLSRAATVAMSMIVNAQSACVLAGNYVFQFSGFRGGGAATHSGAISINGSGIITGEQDYKDPTRTTTAETLTSGTCINRETNTGVLTLNAPSGKLVYNFAATPPDTSGVIHSARLQLISSGSDSGSGQLD
ncbi:MAG TPA: putative Ig domain-containing protein, partial [Steroidobacteraceae bacterium]